MTNNFMKAATLEAAERGPVAPGSLHGADLAGRAAETARSMTWVPGKGSGDYSERLKKLQASLPASLAAAATVGSIHLVEEEQRWLRENRDMLRSQLASLQGSNGGMMEVAHVRTADGRLLPRAFVLAEDFLASVGYRFSDADLADYVHGFQNAVVLSMAELWQLVPAFKFVLLERIVEVVNHSQPATLVSDCIRSLFDIQQAPWPEILEPMIAFDAVLRQDPAGAYAKMDVDSRELYRSTVVKLAEHSDCTELQIAELALNLAKRASLRPHRDPRLAARHSHVGFYLIDGGRQELYGEAGVRLSLRDRLQDFLRRHPNEFYPLGVEVLTLAMILALLWTVDFNALKSLFIAILLLLIPCSQSAVEIMNFLTTSLLKPFLLPKVDFSKGIPEEFTTTVVVPTLLMNEKQVRETVQELEVRFIGNMSRNLNFALLTDLADSAEQPHEDDPLVYLCGNLINDLNRKYAGRGVGTFAMFHRHRVYNRREGLWIGWERKRGKLLDFNKLILGEYDSFPYKAGDLSVLPKVRYVLTLDSDTQLPRGTAQKLIGTMAHPLCQAIVDTRKNIVVEGYGILQPRVGISVESASRSRFASLFSDWTGLDIYTQAVSDVYQDLYGEGSFVGKGLYKLRVVHKVLNGRFPRNQVLSHDLIEGAYTRAGLATDVKVIDSYPSRYSAYARRKHRWVRGDWQLLEWLLGKVPDERGRWVDNPISIISRWKILDNLRRSLVEPVTVTIFLMGWTILPGKPLYWTLAFLAVILLPTVFQFVVNLLRAVLSANAAGIAGSFKSLVTGTSGVMLNFAFRVHDALLSADAIWRSIYRRFVSKRRLLQWETAAESEVGTRKRTPVDLYLLWTPVLCIAIGAFLFFTHRYALPVALPILFLWGFSNWIARWLDRPLWSNREPISRKDELFVRRIALRTWRYFSEYSTAEHNWLIPDNVQEEPPIVAARFSPTNVGLLLNARQIACEMGYLTVPELAEQTRRTLDTLNRLELFRGHLVNWYDTRTLAPLPPRFVSSVDSGNLAASFVVLNHGCRELLQRPLISPALLEGYDDHLRALADTKGFPRWKSIRFIPKRKKQALLQSVLSIVREPEIKEDLRNLKGAEWIANQIQVRKQSLHRLLADFMPWLLPEFAPLRKTISGPFGLETKLAQLPAFAHDLELKLQKLLESSARDDERALAQQLLVRIAESSARCAGLIAELNRISEESDAWFLRMDFTFLLESRRKLLSIGYSVENARLEASCYDLLASESRIAAFLAIAKGDIPQDVWLRLGRRHVGTNAGPVLISWAGTMFEYLMPSLWMGAYPNSLLECSMQRAVLAQRAYGSRHGVPWGISECGYSELNPEGAYSYRFFGVPELALQSEESERLVIAPYAGAMALTVDAPPALANLRRMANRGWFGPCGFYEAADFGPVEALFRKPKLVRSWMVHHQGMVLLAMANFLCADVVRRWFHRDVYVQATDLLMQERMEIRKAPRLRRPAARTTRAA
ncbi:MAG TPA: glucoamylase family protein [Candidatus Koribacter sp.]